MRPLQFMSMYMIGTWKDPFTKDERAAVSVLLPSGTSDRIDDSNFRVESGWILEVEAQWPTASTDKATQENSTNPCPSFSNTNGGE